MLKKVAKNSLAGLLLCGVMGVAVAQLCPTKTITIIVPFSPGGATDVLARAVAQKLGSALGQSVIVDNKPGAGATLVAGLAAKSAPDGYTLFMGAVHHTKNLMSQIAITFLLCFHFSATNAELLMPPFYASVMKMAPEGKLGQVIAKEPTSTSVKGAQAWRIAYISSDAAGRKTISTGSQIAPVGKAPAEGRPVVAWAHGTTGTAQNCGPSQVFNPTAPLNQYFLVDGSSWATAYLVLIPLLLRAIL